ncbi:acid protease [Stipitochalara longipes BDJ]|nr:acid protease [Stipitochalara longipes BDJ]
MPSLLALQAFLLLALVTFVLAAPAPHQPVQKRGSFMVERIPNPNFKRHPNHKRAVGAGTRALLKAYRKYGMPPPGLLDAMAANGGPVSEVSAKEKAGGGIAAQLEGLLGGLTGDGAGNANAATGGGDASAASGAANAKSSTASATKKASKTASAGAAKPTGTGSTGATTASSNSSASAGTGVVAATPEQGDVEYLAPISIGGQTMVMDFDSGSSDLWVFNTQLATASQTGHTNFDPSKSTSFKLMQGASFTISYGDGSGAAGNVGTDTVNIGGATVTSQAIELATAVSSSFVQDTQSNGLVGLAYSKLNTVKPTAQKTFFDNAKENLAMPVFTADLRKNAVGAYTFGAIDSTKFNGSLTWAAVNTTNGFWQFSSTKFQVGTGAAMTVAGGQAIADTGTTLMLANAAVVNAYYSQVTGAVNNQTVGGVTFPCNAQLPDLQVDVGGNYMALVRGDDINFAPVDNAGTTCFGGLQAIASDLQIYGDIMFKSQFVAFNGGNNTIGMAPHQS